MELKPCPFCGESCVFEENFIWNNNDAVRCGCQTLGCRGRISESPVFHAFKYMWEKWNKRLPTQTEQPEELAELRKYNTKLLDENIWYRNANAEIRRNFQRLLNAVNKVTAAHRHGNPVTIRALDNLSNRQLEIERAKDGG